MKSRKSISSIRSRAKPCNSRGDQHKIEIELDTRSLEDAGVNEASPVTRGLQGISLKSALNLILGELDLDYVVDNEVLLITTKEEAESPDRMTTKVYPVADLVLPIQSLPISIGGVWWFRWWWIWRRILIGPSA